MFTCRDSWERTRQKKKKNEMEHRRSSSKLVMEGHFFLRLKRMRFAQKRKSKRVAVEGIEYCGAQRRTFNIIWRWRKMMIVV